MVHIMVHGNKYVRKKVLGKRYREAVVRLEMWGRDVEGYEEMYGERVLGEDMSVGRYRKCEGRVEGAEMLVKKTQERGMRKEI